MRIAIGHAPKQLRNCCVDEEYIAFHNDSLGEGKVERSLDPLRVCRSMACRINTGRAANSFVNIFIGPLRCATE
jgi:hypothetical protein